MAAAAKGGRRRIVVCADGTWNKPDHPNEITNVVRLAQTVLPQDAAGVPQIVCYHKGVGTRRGLDRITGGAFGEGLSANIKDLYLFLTYNFRPGDELFLFGFSRGAYTVRSLAGLIRNCGVLRPEHVTEYENAYKLYRDPNDKTHPKAPASLQFRQRWSWPDFNIRCIGVWDTVGALGVPLPAFRLWNKRRYQFHDTDLSSHVDFAFHALAIDEKRKPFEPTLWRKQSESPPSQVLEQVWFPGVHSDVGGGYPRHGLSDGALLWMADRAIHAGLALDRSRLKAGNANDALHNSLTWGYRMLGDGTRSPGAKLPESNESVHVSATARQRYSPAQLRNFLQRSPPPAVSKP